MDHTTETHYSKIILNNSKEVKGDFKRSILTIVPLDSTIKEFKLHGIDTWILEDEYKSLEENNIDINNIRVMAYVEGRYSPYNKEGNNILSADAYQLHIIY